MTASAGPDPADRASGSLGRSGTALTRSRETSMAEVFDRVLDKGIVIDAWMRVSVVGLELVTVQARVVVASIDTYLTTSEALAQVASGSAP